MTYRPTALPAFEHHLRTYRRTWRASVPSSFVLPVLLLLGLGASVGGYIDGHGRLGVSYLDWTAPGLLASTAFQLAVTESTWPVLSGFSWSRGYQAMRASPLRPSDILRGHLWYVLARVVLASVAFLLVMAAFGAARSRWTPVALPVAVLLGFATAAPVFAFTASVHSGWSFPVLQRFLVVPMTLFGGVFFPVDTMPVPARMLAYISPLWHGVQLCRAVSLGTRPAWPIWVHLGYLLFWGVGGYLLARRLFARRLAD